LTAKYFNHADFEGWIADCNGIADAVTVKAGTVLMIPNPFRSTSGPCTDKECYTIEIVKKQNKLFVTKNGTVIRSFSVATGKRKDLTPTGTFEVVIKLKNPWYSAKGIRGGDPHNPLGTRWLGLNALGTDGTKYGIHGTNNPSSIGRYASSGCVRMNNADVEWLYDRIPAGTKVIIKE
jgi:lipoprotein-anchoring transpeptidase ErfK/SrfK